MSSHKEGWTEGYRFGVEANRPFYARKKENKGGVLPAVKSFLSVSDPFVAMSLIKKADNDNSLIIRLTEMEGRDKDNPDEFDRGRAGGYSGIGQYDHLEIGTPCD